MVATVAAIAAVSVMLATTVVAPEPTPALTAPRLSTEVVALVALPEAAASPEQILDSIYRATLAPVLSGAASGFLVGFVAGGVVAMQLFGRIPVLGIPLVQAVSIMAAIVGVPIGAVVGVLSRLVPTTTHSAAATSAPAARKVSAVEQVSAPVSSAASSTKIPNIGRILASTFGGAFLGLLAGGAAASALVGIPGVGIALAPLAPLAAIGAVIGTALVVKKWVSSTFPKVKLPVPVRPSTAADSRSNRHVATPSTPKAGKTAVSQQRSKAAQARSGRH